MLYLAEIIYSEDKGDNITYQPTIFRLVEYNTLTDTKTPKEKVEKWFSEEYPSDKLLNIQITEPIK